MSSKIALSFAGFHDPYASSAVEGQQLAGPIMSMVDSLAFDVVVLFDTPGTRDNTAKTAETLRERDDGPQVEIHSLDELRDPTQHIQILRYLRRLVPETMSAWPDAEFFILLSSGTPSMHACWLLLVADGTIPARLVYGHPPRHADDDYRVSEVDLSAGEFPEIQPRPFPTAPDADEQVLPGLIEACREFGIVGEDPAFTQALDRAARVAAYDADVLLLGETGTGKEGMAKLIHALSGRSDEKFVAVNCAALSSNLVESTLFGHRKGAFTGADRDQPGEFLQADGGTLFLDEIGELPGEAQAALLRALQEGEIKALGADHVQKVDVKVVAATNRDLPEAMQDGTFRPDLAQRFTTRVTVPPLRKRRGDIIKIATFTLDRWNKRHGQRRTFSRPALRKLQDHCWPGNVRELISIIENAVMLSDATAITDDDLDLDIGFWDSQTGSRLPDPYEGFLLKEYIDGVRAQLMQRALEIAGNNHSGAARLLGVTPQAVHQFVKTNTPGT